MEREAYLYRNVNEDKIECLICQRRCIIHEDKRGWCYTRANRGGKLYSLIYGEVSSLSINPIEKKPVFHFYPGSRWLSLGSLGCTYCHICGELLIERYIFDIITNKIKGGKCFHCGCTISGRFPDV